MAVVDLILPKLGESIMEATILKWHKKPGDKIEQDETVLEIATDKVDSEVPSTAAGVLQEILFKENDVVPVGAVIARIASENGEVKTQPSEEVKAQPEEIPVPEAHEEVVPFVPHQYTATTNSSANRFYSPLVLNIAGSEGISMSELEKIPGTGNEGRVTKKDLLAYVEDKKAGSKGTEKPTVTEFEQLQETSETNIPEQAFTDTTSQTEGRVVKDNVEIVEMDRMRKLIAKHMVDSKNTSVHVTSFSEADVTNMVLWRERIKREFERKEDTKITYTPMFIDCIARVIKRFPIINSSVEGDKIIIKKDINIGMATALPGGNLIVPVIHNADYLNLIGLSKKVNTLANNARSNKLKAEDIQGGTFTLTNVGSFGSMMGTPIINQPQVAIMAVGVMKKRPVVIETKQGDTIGIRHMMYISLSYDHRIIDGSIGATFLSAVAKEMENWDVNRNP